MNRKFRKTKNKNMQTIQGTYSIQRSSQKQRQSLSQGKFRTINPDKLEKINNSLKSRNKRVFLTDMSQYNIREQKGNQNLIYNPSVEESDFIQNASIQQGYYPRTKSSNGYVNNNKTLMKQTNKFNKINKQLNLLFENQLYWNNNNSFLVAGVKNQYEKMKKNYQSKCEEVLKLKKEYKIDTVNQLKKYIKNLEQQNINLVSLLQKQYHKINNKNSKMRLTALQLLSQKLQTQQTENNKINYELEIKQNQKLKNKNTLLENKIEALSRQNKNLIKKVVYLEKLIIQKQNSQFNALKKCKKFEKLERQLFESNKTIKSQLTNLQKSSKNQLQKLKNRLKQQHQTQKQQIIRQIKIKSQKITKLQKQNHHLKTMVDHWKSNQISLATNQKSQQQQKNDYTITNYNTKLSLDVESDKINKNNMIKIKLKNSLDSDLLANNNNTNTSRKYFNSISQQSFNKSTFKNNIQQINQKQLQNQMSKGLIKRQRITALTQKQDSVKSRPVQLNEIQPIVQYLKLKLAYQGILSSSIKDYFTYQKTKQLNTNKHLSCNNQNSISISISQIQKYSPREVNKNQPTIKQYKQLPIQNNRQSLMQQDVNYIQWSQQYITLKEVYDIFVNKPFMLQQNQSLLLSRFIIEDMKDNYVYINWDSENSRRIVQSIIHNLLGNYESINQTTKQKGQILLKKFQLNIIPALKSVSKNGKVSQQKFFEIFNGLGLQRTKFMDQYILGKMCLYSLSLQQLEYSYLYKQKKD